MIPEHCWARLAFDEVLEVEQQLVPTLRLCTLQYQLFDLLRLHSMHSSWMFDASPPPPHEKGVMWSYSRLSELPQHLHLPPSLV